MYGATDKTKMIEAGFGKIKFAKSAVYLGITIGRKITAKEIFAKAKTKFFKRLKSFRICLASSSMHQRIMIANIYLIPVLLYIGQFYIAPFKSVVSPITNALRRAVIPFNGGGFGYAHLIAGRHTFGPALPLRDFWGANLTALAVDGPTDLRDFDGEPDPPGATFGRIAKRGCGSLRTSDQHLWVCYLYLKD